MNQARFPQARYSHPMLYIQDQVVTATGPVETYALHNRLVLNLSPATRSDAVVDFHGQFSEQGLNKGPFLGPQTSTAPLWDSNLENYPHAKLKTVPGP